MRFILTADWHLRLSSMGMFERGLDFFEAARNVIKLATQHGVRHILHGGDILHTKVQHPTVMSQLISLDQEAKRAGITVWTVSGNHDAIEPHWITVLQKLPTHPDHNPDAGIKLLDGTTAHLNEGPESMTVLGLPPVSREGLIQAIKLHKQQFDVLLWHGAVKELAGFPDDTMVHLADLPTNRCKAVLLGDIHKRQFVQVGDCLVGYPGATEVANRDDPLDPTCTLMEWRNNKISIVEHLPVAVRKTIALRIDSEVALTEALETLKAHKKNATLILARYLDTLQNVPNMLKLNAGPDTLIRCAHYHGADTVDFMQHASQGAAAEDKPAVAFLPSLMAGHEDLIPTAIQLCDPAAPHRDIINNLQQQLLK